MKTLNTKENKNIMFEDYIPNSIHQTYYYSFGNALILLRSGDIEVNPRPMLNILETHPHHTNEDTKHILLLAQ